MDKGPDEKNSIISRIALYDKTAFFEAVKCFTENSAPGDSYCLIAIDIEHFILFNEWYGQTAGDNFLLGIGRHLKKFCGKYNGIGAYMGEDNFALLLSDNENILNALEQDIINYVCQYNGTSGFLPAMGIYRIEDTTLPVQTMYDYALIALNSTKGNYAKRSQVYDSRMIEVLEADHVLLTEIQTALNRHEFTFYLQPKCNLSTGKIVSLESLVRWNHPVRGIVTPDKFIPLLEKNGLITALDIYVWNLVCQWLRSWIDNGRRPIPVSVNVSRSDIYAIDISEHFKDLIERYQLPSNLLIIEITESAYAKDNELITSVVDKLSALGFIVSMDDFGSGYSSLNMLKDMHFDELKIDMAFLKIKENSQTELKILETIVSMARLLNLTIIAEGIETEKQLELLLNIGCRYGQGYYFYRPIPYEDMAQILLDESKIDYRSTHARQVEPLQVRELLNQDMFTESILNNILGGIAFYDVYDNKVELLRVNEQYCKITESNPFDLDAHRKSMIDVIHKADRGIVWGLFHLAYKNKLEGAEGEVRRIKDDGTTIWIHLRIFFLKEQNDHGYFYGSVNDISWHKEKEASRHTEQLPELYFLNYDNPSGYYVCADTENLDFIYVSTRFMEITGYTRTDIREIFHDNFTEMIHPQDRETVRLPKKKQENSICMQQFHLAKKGDGYIWAYCQFKYIKYANFSLIQGVISDITSFYEKNYKLWISDKKIESILNQAQINTWDWNIREGTLSLHNYSAQSLVSEILSLPENDTLVFSDFPEDILKLPHIPSPLKALLTEAVHGIQTNPPTGIFSRELALTAPKSGRQLWVKISGEIIFDEKGHTASAFGFFEDITLEKMQIKNLFETKKALKHYQSMVMKAGLDDLSGLLSRKTAMAKIQEYLEQPEDIEGTLIMFDLDNFKQANDVFGHTYGDQLIQENALKLKSFFRADDIVCRIGGDEFLILCKDIQPENIENKLKDIIKNTTITRTDSNQEITFTLSAGYAVIPIDGRDFDTLYHKADVALFTAKTAGKNAFRKYHPSMKATRFELL